MCHGKTDGTTSNCRGYNQRTICYVCWCAEERFIKYIQVELLASPTFGTKKCFFPSSLLPPSTVYLAVLKSSWQNTHQILLWDGFKKASFYIQSCCGSYMHSYLQKSLPKILPGVCHGILCKGKQRGNQKTNFQRIMAQHIYHKKIQL